MPTLDQTLQPIATLRSQRDALDQQVYANGLQLQKLKGQLALQSDPAQITALQQAIDAEQTALATGRQNLAAAQASVQKAIDAFYAGRGPQQVIGQLPDNIPFALLPVRMETRFNTTNPKTPELWIRVYPDDVAIQSFEKTLTDAEVDAGEVYWTALFSAVRTGSGQDAMKDAWTLLVGQFGSGRAAWVALQTKPTNWTDASATQPIFPAFDLTKTQAWSRAPRTNVMPDKFVLMCYTGNTPVQEVTGNPIPDELTVGPDPLDADNSFVTTGGSLGFGPDYDWTSNFDKAVAVGMGFKIPLTTDQARTGFDRIIALGVYLSKSQDDSRQALEDLIDNHHYSPQGFALLPQGSPTNNTDQTESAFTQSDPFANISYLVEAGDPLFQPGDDCDGRNLANALGINYGPLQYIANARGTDNRDAVLLNKALYPGTLGYFTGSLLSPVLSDTAQQTLGDFFTRYVTGRGPLPAFRVGSQPYGVLLTSDFSAWKWQERETLYPSAFLQTLYRVLGDYQQIWNGLSPQLAFTGKTGADPAAMLVNILGLQPGSATFFQRNAYSTDNLINLAAFQYGGRYYKDIQQNFISKTLGLAWLQSFGYASPAVPQILRLVYQHETTTLDPANLVDSIPLSESAPIHYYDTSSKKNYLDWLAAAASVDDLQAQNFGSNVPAPTALLYSMLRKSLLQSLHAGSVHWFGVNGVDLTGTLGAVNFHNIRPGGTLTKWEVLHAPVSTALPASPQAAMAIGDYLLGPGATDPDAVSTADIKAALAELAPKPGAQLGRCFTEHIDTLTYRLDSWQMGMFAVRLEEMRGTSSVPSSQQGGRQTGIWLGAYGWLESVRPAARQVVPPEQLPPQLVPDDKTPVYAYADNGGYVHAPSINHASAAAILRSGYLSHATTAMPDAMAVNLSSDRVRRALLVMDGIRTEQPIEVLLGYQFERGLHDRASQDNSLLKLNDYIYDFRDQYPIPLTVVPAAGAAPAETIPATDVVNGLTLSQTTLAFPYGATGDVTSASPGETAAIEAEWDNLNDTLDAVKDLLTTEGVYQLVLGNADRAGAVINSMQEGIAPPVLDSIETPRGSQFTFSNRVGIQFANGDPGLQATNPWFPIPMTPRAAMETGMNKWLGSILGDPSALVAQVSQQDAAGNLSHTQVMSIAQLNLQPIDLVYTDVQDIQTRLAYLYRSAGGLSDAVTVNISFLLGAPGKTPLGRVLSLLQKLKTLVTDARPLNAQDFNTAAQPGTTGNPKGYDTAELGTRITAARSAFDGALQRLRGIALQATVTVNGTTTVYGVAGDVFDALDKAQLTFGDITFDILPADATKLRDALLAIANGGLDDAFPQVQNAASATVLEQGRSIAARMADSEKTADGFITQAAGLTDPEKITETLVDAGQALLGSDFNVVPAFRYNNESDILQSKADPALLSYATSTLKMPFPADEWMQNAAQVRPRLARWDDIRLLSESRGTNLDVTPVQVPYRHGDTWVAVEFDPSYTLTQDTLSFVLHGDQSFVSGSAHSGLLVDEWNETIPTREETTGICFNFNAPGAFPPQAILLAVPPQLKGQWDWNSLVGILTDTLNRAKLRAVEPALLATVDKPEVSVLLPALLSNFTQSDLDLSLDFRTNIGYVSTTFPVTSLNA